MKVFFIAAKTNWEELFLADSSALDKHQNGRGADGGGGGGMRGGGG